MSDVREAVLAALDGLSELDDGAESAVVRRSEDGDAEVRIAVEARTLAGDPVARARTDATDGTGDAADRTGTDDQVVWSDGDVAVLDDDERTEGGEDR